VRMFQLINVQRKTKRRRLLKNFVEQNAYFVYQKSRLFVDECSAKIVYVLLSEQTRKEILYSTLY